MALVQRFTERVLPSTAVATFAPACVEDDSRTYLAFTRLIGAGNVGITTKASPPFTEIALLPSGLAPPQMEWFAERHAALCKAQWFYSTNGAGGAALLVYEIFEWESRPRRYRRNGDTGGIVLGLESDLTELLRHCGEDRVCQLSERISWSRRQLRG